MTEQKLVEGEEIVKEGNYCGDKRGSINNMVFIMGKDEKIIIE